MNYDHQEAKCHKWHHAPSIIPLARPLSHRRREKREEKNKKWPLLNNLATADSAHCTLHAVCVCVCVSSMFYFKGCARASTVKHGGIGAYVNDTWPSAGLPRVAGKQKKKKNRQHRTCGCQQSYKPPKGRDAFLTMQHNEEEM